MDDLSVRTQILPAGGGAFRLERLTVGIFLTDQPYHRLAVGGDRREFIPLSQKQGWVFSAGTEGICEYDEQLSLVTVSIDDTLLRDAGAAKGGVFRRVGALDPLLVQLVLSAENFSAGGRMYRETMSRALAVQLVATLDPPTTGQTPLDDIRLRRAVEHVHARLGEDLSLEGLAAEAGMSTFHFARSFKAATGVSPLQYVIRTRLETAQALLKSTKLSIAEIAYRVGYEDVSRFGQHFRRQFGMTPAAFRDS